MNNPYLQVKEFHKAFNHLYNDKPTVIDEETALNRAVWTGEEIIEFLYASVDGDLERFKDITADFIVGLIEAYKKIYENQPDVSDKLVAQADALVDTLYFVYGSFTILGVEPQPLFDIVQNANMGKLFPDGKPRYREEDGKIIKPPNWEKDFAPESKLKEEIQRQANK